MALVVLERDGMAKLTLELVAGELGVTKQALYHYFPSKHALLTELVFAELEACADAIHAASEAAPDGASALEAVIRAYVAYYLPRLEAFRLVVMHVQQVEGVTFSADVLARLRPLNDRMYGVATAKLLADRRPVRGGRVEPIAARRMVFAAQLAAQGFLSMRTIVDRFADPLRYGDDEMVDEMCRAFRASAEKAGFA